MQGMCCYEMGQDEEDGRSSNMISEICFFFMSFMRCQKAPSMLGSIGRNVALQRPGVPIQYER